MTEPNRLRPTTVSGVEDERPLGTIVAELWENTQHLARQEIALGIAQLEERVSTLKAELIRTALASAVLYAGVLALVAAIVLALSKAMDPWLAAFLTGAVLAVTGYLVLRTAKAHAEPHTSDEHPALGHRHMKEALK
jgi:hypothetical protein